MGRGAIRVLLEGGIQLGHGLRGVASADVRLAELEVRIGEVSVELQGFAKRRDGIVKQSSVIVGFAGKKIGLGGTGVCQQLAQHLPGFLRVLLLEVGAAEEIEDTAIARVGSAQRLQDLYGGIHLTGAQLARGKQLERLPVAGFEPYDAREAREGSGEELALHFHEAEIQEQAFVVGAQTQGTLIGLFRFGQTIGARVHDAQIAESADVARVGFQYLLKARFSRGAVTGRQGCHCLPEDGFQGVGSRQRPQR